MQWYDILFIIVALILIVLSLLQGGKSEGASGAITGGGLNVFVKTKERGSEKGPESGDNGTTTSELLTFFKLLK